MSKKVLILGAGKIGRGFLADVLGGDNELIFADANEELVEKMNSAGKYTLLSIGQEQTSKEISGFSAYHIGDDRLIETSDDLSLMAVAVFPDAFGSVADFIITVIRRRMAIGITQPLDCIVCANILHPVQKLKDLIDERLTGGEKTYVDACVGFIESIVLRMAINPTTEMLANDPLVVATNGYPELPLDGTAFKGERPVNDKIIYTDNMKAEECRKLYTYNMVHCLFSYLGVLRGYNTVYECTTDTELTRDCTGALDEVKEAVMKEFGFSPETMAQWNNRLMQNMANPYLNDELVRVGANPIRKLARNDRLTGALLLCRKNGIMPFYLAKAIAAGLMYDNDTDEQACGIQKCIRQEGCKAAIFKYCGLEREHELVDLIYRQFLKLSNGQLTDDPEYVGLMSNAYSAGFKFEKTFKGCAQCTIAAMSELTNLDRSALFQAASGLSGGMAICGDGCCGGYNGGILFMSSLIGRRLDKIPVDGDKSVQYTSFEMAQKLHDRFIDVYGSVICSDMHMKIFGQSYCLRTEEVRVAFEEAGAHQDKCTSVIAAACTWIVEIMREQNLI